MQTTPIPKGLTQCEVCGMYRGKVRLGDLSKSSGIAHVLVPDKVVEGTHVQLSS